MLTAPAIPQLAGKAGVVAKILGVSSNTVRRAHAEGPGLPATLQAHGARRPPLAAGRDPGLRRAQGRPSCPACRAPGSLTCPRAPPAKAKGADVRPSAPSVQPVRSSPKPTGPLILLCHE